MLYIRDGCILIGNIQAHGSYTTYCVHRGIFTVNNIILGATGTKTLKLCVPFSVFSFVDHELLCTSYYLQRYTKVNLS